MPTISIARLIAGAGAAETARYPAALQQGRDGGSDQNLPPEVHAMNARTLITAAALTFAVAGFAQARESDSYPPIEWTHGDAAQTTPATAPRTAATDSFDARMRATGSDERYCALDYPLNPKTGTNAEASLC